jgi:hypothetical protein
MLRALRTHLGSGVPVIGVNFGRVGFLSSMQPEELEVGLTRAFRGELEVVALPTLEVVNGDEHVAVNDVVVTSAVLGRMVELEWAVGGEDLGSVACDGLVCSTPSGSTAYNLSNGGPVLMWGIDAMTTTFVAPHSLHARPLVVPRGKDVHVVNRTSDVPVVVIADGRLATSRRRHGHRPPRGGADAACDAAGRDVRQPLPGSSRRRPLATEGPVSSVAAARARASVRTGAARGAGLRSISCCAGCGSKPCPHPRGRPRARPGLVALTGETGAGKTIVTQAIGLLLGAKGDATAVGAASGRGVRRGETRRCPTGSSTRTASSHSAICARTASPASSSRAA